MPRLLRRTEGQRRVRLLSLIRASRLLSGLRAAYPEMSLEAQTKLLRVELYLLGEAKEFQGVDARSSRDQLEAERVAALIDAQVSSARRKLAMLIAKLVRTAGLDYGGFASVCRIVREQLGLSKPSVMSPPRLLSREELAAFYGAVQRGGNVQHQTLLQLLLFAAMKVSELVNLRAEDIDLPARRMFVAGANRNKGRYVPFPESCCDILGAYLLANPQSRYLFEGRHGRPLSTRRVQQIITHYANESGLAERVYPHLFRRQMLVWLASQGLSGPSLQLISGHASERNLEAYRRLAGSHVEKQYEAAVKELRIAA